MKIEISDQTYQAIAAVEPDVSAFIENALRQRLQVEQLASQDPRGTLSEDQLRQSVAELAAADASIDADGGIDLEEAFQQIAEKHGLPLKPRLIGSSSRPKRTKI